MKNIVNPVERVKVCNFGVYVSSYLVRPADIRGDTAVLTGDEAVHASKSARKRPGDELLLIDGVGTGYRCVVRTVEGDRVVCEIREAIPQMGEPCADVTLAVGMVKGDRFDSLVETAVELGAGAIVPLETRFSIVHHTSENRQRRWNRIAESAAKQCLRSRVPPVEKPEALRSFAERTGEFDAVFVAWEGQQEPTSPFPAIAPGSILLVVGPEGGFHDEEIGLLRSKGARTVPLGPRRLRTGTAAIALLTLALQGVGEYARCLAPHVD